MAGGIYLIQDNGQLVEMIEQPYDSEALLQELLAKYPDLLAGDQMNSAAPRRWLLISREAGLPSEADGANRWSVDHLFLDQDGIPTLIEVKRSSDTRIRREVVGQMLDYAANAVVYWPIERIRAQFEATCVAGGVDAGQSLSEFLGFDADHEQFWQQVRTNLQAGRVRMVFVADDIPAELKRIVEFLNVQMNPAEVLAVEIRQYVGQGVKSLVPRVIGHTAEAQQVKSTGSREVRKWDEAAFFQELESRRGAAEADIARKILAWAKSSLPDIWWGEGKRSGSFIPGLMHKGVWRQVIGVWTYGLVEIQFQYMRANPPFDDDAKRLELLRRINQLPGIDPSWTDDTINRRPSIAMAVFKDEVVLDQFFDILDWVVQEVKAS
ncbi:MAG TPA: hypothetical protein VKA60_23370 [Blastocatellia bacterium]|nr:hypothetical protein [Blastocatellia bacterium]